MTTGIVLGTSEGKHKVLRVTSIVGFVPSESLNIFNHEIVKGLVLQIHSPVYFSGVERIVTEMEFDDHTNQFPNNPIYDLVLSQ